MLDKHVIGTLRLEEIRHTMLEFSIAPFDLTSTLSVRTAVQQTVYDDLVSPRFTLWARKMYAGNSWSLAMLRGKTSKTELIPP